MKVKTLSLSEVDDIEAHCAYFVLIMHTEIKPLVVAARVRIHAHVTVVLIRLHLDHHVQIT